MDVKPKLFLSAVFIAFLFLPGCGSGGFSLEEIPYAFVLFEQADLPPGDDIDPAARLEMLSSHWGSYIYYDVYGDIHRRTQGPSGTLSPDGRKLLFHTSEGPTLRDLFVDRETLLAGRDEAVERFEIPETGFSADGRYAFFGSAVVDFETGPVLNDVVRYDLERGEESGRCGIINLPELNPEQGKFVERIWEHDPGGFTVSADARMGFTFAWDPLTTDAEEFIEPVSYLEIPLANFMYEGLYGVYRLDFETGDVEPLAGAESGYLWIPPLLFDDNSGMLYLVRRHYFPQEPYYQVMAIGPGGDEFEVMRAAENLHLIDLSTDGTRLAYYAVTKDNTGIVRKSYGMIDLRDNQPEVYFELPLGLNEVAFGPDMDWAVYISLTRSRWDELLSFFPPQGPRPYLHIIEFQDGTDSILFAIDPPGTAIIGIVPLDRLP